MIVAPTTVLVDPTADLQAAIDALGSGGGIVQLGPGTYPLITVGLTVPYGVTLAGSGMGTTYLEMDNPNTDIVTVTGAYATVRDLTITVKASARAAGTGVGLKLKASSSALMSECEFKNLNIFSTGSWGIKICDISNTYEPADYSLGYIVGPGFSHVTVFDCRSGGALYSGAGVSTPKFHYFSSVCKGYRPAWPSRPSGAWKWPPMDAYGIGFTDYLPAGAVYLFITTDATFDKCFFQSHTDSDNTPAISIEDCISTAFNDCYFEHLNSTTRTAR